MNKIVYISGYYKDNPDHTFEDYKCVIGFDVDEDEEDDIFFYFESEEEIKSFSKDVGNGIDFIVTSYEID